MLHALKNKTCILYNNTTGVQMSRFYYVNKDDYTCTCSPLGLFHIASKTDPDTGPDAVFFTT